MADVGDEDFPDEADPSLGGVFWVEVFCHEFADLDEGDLLVLVEVG